jgi:predicted dithiol-disulfide oxidoreductase (DUF899 family)
MGNLPEVVSREEWLAACKELLAREEEPTRARDRVNADAVGRTWSAWTSRTRSRVRTERSLSDGLIPDWAGR